MTTTHPPGIDQSYFADTAPSFHWAAAIYYALRNAAEFEARKTKRGKAADLHPIVALVRLEARSRRCNGGDVA